jgi:Homeodomain-like domain-containing protein
VTFNTESITLRPMEKRDFRSLGRETQEALRVRAVFLVLQLHKTQAEAAEAVGVSRQIVNQWLRNYASALTRIDPYMLSETDPLTKSAMLESDDCAVWQCTLDSCWQSFRVILEAASLRGLLWAGLAAVGARQHCIARPDGPWLRTARPALVVSYNLCLCVLPAAPPGFPFRSGNVPDQF